MISEPTRPCNGARGPYAIAMQASSLKHISQGHKVTGIVPNCYRVKAMHSVLNINSQNLLVGKVKHVLYCHGNFGPAKKLVWGTNIPGKLVRLDHFCLKKLVLAWNNGPPQTVHTMVANFKRFNNQNHTVMCNMCS